ncbi:hypothetical protein DN752_19365 [Echinicola strongylocentroti]|uniref:Uncharacterized protein n=1 Tax=Echinicola strongylocentroti TaxID=1795355 RepID=A0A2Z4IP55_9BACT|nr:hypothetical protein DN752_19365 [Echinicola strongylocentroti]
MNIDYYCFVSKTRQDDITLTGFEKKYQEEKKQPSWRRGYFDGLMAYFIATKTRSHQEVSWEVSCSGCPYCKKTLVPWHLCGLVYCHEGTKSPRG